MFGNMDSYKPYSKYANIDTIVTAISVLVRPRCFLYFSILFCAITMTRLLSNLRSSITIIIIRIEKTIIIPPMIDTERRVLPPPIAILIPEAKKIKRVPIQTTNLSNAKIAFMDY